MKYDTPSGSGCPANITVLEIPYDERHSGIPEINHMRNDSPQEGIGRNKKRFFTTADPLELRLCSFHNQYITALPNYPW